MSTAPRNRSFSERAVEALLSRMAVGELTLERPDGSLTEFAGSEPGPHARVRIVDPAAARRILTRGSLGMAEGYMEGDWETPDLCALLDLGIQNTKHENVGRIPSPLRPTQRLWHRMRSNSKRGSRRNISYHYDLGNEFYGLWLDDTMAYSSALFCESGDAQCEDLQSAQRAKWNRLLEVLQPSRADHLLELGCGWGGFAIHAAKEAGCKVTGVTISREQYDWAQRYIAHEGLEGRVDIRLQDYRDISEQFTRLVSVEMFEAVGEKYWPVFFGRVRDLLGRGGKAAIQTITISDESFEQYRDNPDFIQRYIFPGGMLPSPERFSLQAHEAGLVIGEPHFFGLSYARTLERWLERFDSARDQVLDMGFDERFVRMWRYYLAYCRAGFMAGNIDVMQIELER